MEKINDPKGMLTAYPKCLQKLTDDEIKDIIEYVDHQVRQTGDGDDGFETTIDLDNSYASSATCIFHDFMFDRENLEATGGME